MEKMINSITGRSYLFLLFVFSSIHFGAFAQGDLLVYPTRLIFEGTQERVKILNFRNQGQDSATYKLSYIENRMTENGRLEIIEAPDEGQLFASPFLRFYPRSITLAPGETQTVKIQLSRTSDLANGEYRSHLYIRAEENQVLEKKNSLKKPESISIQLKPIYGISIPHIIRIGDTKVETDLQDVSLSYTDTIPVLSMKVIRNGNQSLNGLLEVVHINSEGISTLVAKKAVIIYTPIGFQHVTMNLDTLEGNKFNSGRLAITFTDREGEKKLLASENVDL